jgi:hypothetical protein
LGSIVGGLAMTGRAAFLRSGSMSYAMKAMAPGAIGAVGGIAYGQMTGKDLATTLEIGSAVSMVFDIGSSLFIKCFIAETPVWVPAQGDGSLYAHPELLAHADATDASIAQIGAGISLAILTSLSFSALMRPAKSNDEEDEEERRHSSIDSVFGSRDDTWKDLADVLWSDPHGPPQRRQKLGFS